MPFAEQAFIIRLLSVSIGLAKSAGKVVKKVINSGDLKTIDKGVNDFQTEADRLSQLTIIKGLRNHFKTVRIVGEEEDLDNNHDFHIDTEIDHEILQKKCPVQWENLKEEDVTIWVDPLDGTNEFTQGLLDHVTVLIGVSHASRAIAGVLLQPFWHPDICESMEPQTRLEKLLGHDSQQKCVWALKHLGVFGIVPIKTPSNGQIIVTTTRSHGSSMIQKTLDAMGSVRVKYEGGCGHKMMLLIEGKAHIYIFPSLGTKKWDSCAPEAILSEAGGSVSDCNGNDLIYPDSENRELFLNSEGIFASSDQLLAEQYITKVKSVWQSK